MHSSPCLIFLGARLLPSFSLRWTLAICCGGSCAPLQLYSPQERHLVLLAPMPGTSASAEPKAARTTRVRTHTALVSREGLTDLLDFLRFFVTHDVLHGRTEIRTLLKSQVRPGCTLSALPQGSPSLLALSCCLCPESAAPSGPLLFPE